MIAQQGLGEGSVRVIVDDESQDGTAAAVELEIAAGAPLQLVRAGPLPRGWFGKPHACWRGAVLAQGEWLCFIDADVRISPQLIAAAIDAAEAQGLDMLSLHPFQELGSFWERLVMPAGLLMIACAKRFRSVAEFDASPDTTNGQFLLIRREVYFGVGGHAAVRAEICEDKALAARVVEAGFRFRVLTAENLARTRMYRDFRSLWEGLGKNATEILGSTGATLAAAAVAIVTGWTTLLLPIALGAAVWHAPSAAADLGFALALSGSLVVLGVQLGTARHFRIPAVFGLLFGLGYTVAACLACRSALLHLDGRVTWKGRTYRLRRKPSPGRP
ncbi:MAG TPA: glycosyltransferase family A protein [Stellaceae bacterium]|nr:glycosyltransferase family A protein [Stellaceae bacterium]